MTTGATDMEIVDAIGRWVFVLIFLAWVLFKD